MMIREFIVQQVGNSLIQVLEGELGNRNVLRLSLDVLLPERVTGDEDGFCESIRQTSVFLSRHMHNGVIDIEVLKIGRHGSTVTVNVEIRGRDGALTHASPDAILEEWSKQSQEIPYRTSLALNAGQYQFSFQITFSADEMYGEASSQPFRDKRILLVEDNEMNALVFASFLEEWGCSVTQASDGNEAISAAGTKTFDFILMDIYMPGLNGIEAIRQIRKDNTTIPIVALTASSLEEDLRESLAAGANDFLLKPISSQQLRKLLEKYF